MSLSETSLIYYVRLGETNLPLLGLHIYFKLYYDIGEAKRIASSYYVKPSDAKHTYIYIFCNCLYDFGFYILIIIDLC